MREREKEVSFDKFHISVIRKLNRFLLIPMIPEKDEIVTSHFVLIAN